VSEIEEDLLSSDDSVEYSGSKKVYSLSKFTKMFNQIYADHFDET
jgi:hypothetical protein